MKTGWYPPAEDPSTPLSASGPAEMNVDFDKEIVYNIMLNIMRKMMNDTILQRWLDPVLGAATEAGRAILGIAGQIGQVVDKEDGSPLTRAFMVRS